MNATRSCLLVVATWCVAVGSSGCSQGGEFPVLGGQSLRALHAVPGAPSVDVIAADSTLANDLAFGEATPFLPISSGLLLVKADAAGAGAPLTIIPEKTLAIEPGMRYDFLAIGNANTGTIDSLVIANPAAPVPERRTRLQLVHAAPGADAVDIYLTTFTAFLASADPIVDGPLQFGSVSPRFVVGNGPFQIRMTLPGEKFPIYDSGLLELRDGEDLLILAVDLPTSESPISLLVVNSSGAVRTLAGAPPPDLSVLGLVPTLPE